MCSKHRAVWALLVMAVTVGSCLREVEVPLGSPFQIRAGDVVLIAGTDLRLRFDRVASDSRCPRDVNCIAAGEAVVVIDASLAGREPEQLRFHIPGGVNGGATAIHEGYRIRIDALEPAPVAGVPTDPAAYVATLVVER